MGGYVVQRPRVFPIMMAICILLAVTLPYIITVSKDRLNMFLPYISHAASLPPESAFLSIFTTIGTFFAVPTFILRYVCVDQKRRRVESKKIRILNVLAVVVGLGAALAMLMTSHYPLGYVTHDKIDWMAFVVVPHFACTAILVTLYTVYVLIQAYLTYMQRKRSTMNVFIHATLAMCVVITNWTCCVPFYAAMRDMAPSIINSETGEINLESQEYTFYYIISSLSQWAFTFFSILFITTFYREFANMRLTIKVAPKAITEMRLDSVHGVSNSHSNGNDEITKM